MSDLIERDALKEAFQNVINDCTCPMHIAAEIDQILDCAPAVDAEPVVRCKDCEFAIPSSYSEHALKCEHWQMDCKKGGFCSYGKRR